MLGSYRIETTYGCSYEEKALDCEVQVGKPERGNGDATAKETHLSGVMKDMNGENKIQRFFNGRSKRRRNSKCLFT